jgi:hypothetical protein
VSAEKSESNKFINYSQL